MIKRLIIILCVLLAAGMLLTGCFSSGGGEKEMYNRITPQQAKEIMDTGSDYIILDVRTQEEYDLGHIPGAVLIPDTEIAHRAESELPQKDQLILVYCRSGRRSKLASEELAGLGYTNIHEFGGIIDWPYEITE